MLKRKDIFQTTTHGGMTHITPVPFRPTHPANIGSAAFNGIHPVTDDMARQAAFMLALAGVPTPAFVEENTVKKFQIEAIYPGGMYDGTTKDATCLSEAIDIMLSSRVGVVVARGYVAEVKKGEVRSFMLMNGVRI